MFYNLITVIRFAKGDGQMSSFDEARQTQLDNIQKKTGKSLDELTAPRFEVDSKLISWIESAYESAG